MRRTEGEQNLSKIDGVPVTRVDIQDQANISEAISAGIARFGKIDVLIKNAG
ncbi:MAG: short-chain dehydrogenase/reductase [Bryobacterales bacterium]|jgi:NADP-dependent 3-hydroxy acid dehydrogenase YdfG|nr:short-chain dehydrogenase/reductase [Bryobacterales bacterium]